MTRAALPYAAVSWLPRIAAACSRPVVAESFVSSGHAVLLNTSQSARESIGKIRSRGRSNHVSGRPRSGDPRPLLTTNASGAKAPLSGKGSDAQGMLTNSQAGTLVRPGMLDPRTPSQPLVSSPFVTKLGRLSGHRAPISGMAWSPDAKWLASCAEDGVLHVWSDPSVLNRPRLARTSTGLAFTKLSWSSDGAYLTCGSTTGALSTWDVSADFEPIWHASPATKAAIRCLAWAPGESCLAIGGDDRLGHLHDYNDSRPSNKRVLLGHESAILCVAWAPTGDALVTGTAAGTIGVWTPSDTRGNQLWELLCWEGIRAHAGPIRALAWSADTNLLASGGSDGRLHLWNVADRELVDQVIFGEAILDLRFAPDGQIIVVKTRDHIRFVRTDPLLEVCSYFAPEPMDSTAGPIAIDQHLRLATIDPDDGSTIVVWQLDIRQLMQQAALTRRTFRAARVSLLGETRSGKSNLARLLTHKDFLASTPTHASQVHRSSSATTIRISDEHEEVREIAFWDPTNTADNALVQRIRGADSAVALLVLSPVEGTEPTAQDNLDRWQPLLRSWTAIRQQLGSRFFLVLSKCDQYSREVTGADVKFIAHHLGVDDAHILATSSKTAAGIQELGATVANAVRWDNATMFPSFEGLGYLSKLVHDLRFPRPESRDHPQYVASVREIYRGLLRMYPFIRSYVTSQEEVRQGAYLLDVLGETHLFAFEKRDDEILLTADYYGTYVNALIAAAERDERQMGRLLLTEALSGRGRHISIDESHRLPDQKQEVRLLDLLVAEMIAEGIAQIVSTNQASYLVFPTSVTAIRSVAERRSEPVRGRLVGNVRAIYQSFVVRVLGLPSHYQRPELYVNEAIFNTPAGGQCGVMMAESQAGDEADLVAHFHERTSAADRAAFLEMLRQHVRDAEGKLFGDLSGHSDEGTTIVVSSSTQPSRPSGSEIEVYVSWNSTGADGDTAENVSVIAAQLRNNGIALLGDLDHSVGHTPEERESQIEKSAVALFLLTGPLTASQEVLSERLDEAGCRIIPVILPNARRKFSIPPALKSWPHIDLRGKVVDVARLARELIEAAAKGRRKPVGRANTPAELSATATSMPYRFDVALSFPGEHRTFVAKVAKALASTNGAHRVLYDKFHDAELARLDLDVYLPKLYGTESELLVVFLCPEYMDKRWCKLEWRRIRQLISTMNAHRIMFVSFGDPGDLSQLGILPGDGYIDISRSTPAVIAKKILHRLRLNGGHPAP
jgi:WD40 repeat protein